MAKDTDLVTFTVDVMDERVGFVEIRACRVHNIDGDLIFTDAEDTAMDMIARGQWKRCKIREA